MAQFTVRMVLHGADRSDYETLHENMTQRGFTDEIRDSATGTLCKMPDGEYDYQGNLTPEEVRGKAARAAEATGRQYAVFVTQSAGRAWVGLKKA